MSEAVDALEELSLDPQARRVARKRWEDAKFLEMGFALTREEGIEQGREQGLEQGLEQGIAVGEAKALLSLLEARQLEVSDDDCKRILATADVEQLDRMVRRAATAASTAEIFE
jgi:flagellar biosynthesis/type III secretory pathway protein FliH